MYPQEFDYLRAQSEEEAVDLLQEHEDAELLAGGHSLLPTIKSRLSAPDVVVDVGHIDSLEGIREQSGGVRIGAITRYADVAKSATVQSACRILSEAAGEIGDRQVRNRGTVGGNIAHSDPASDLPATVLAADATIHALGPDGTRTIDVDDFFVGIYETALDEAELLTRVDVPSFGATDAGAYVKKPSPSSGYALVGVAAAVHTDGDVITGARVAVNGAVEHAVRLSAVEDALAGEPVAAESAEAAASRAGESVESFRYMDDLQATPEYREELVRAYTETALLEAFDRVESA